MRRSKFEQVISLFRAIQNYPNDSAYFVCMTTGIRYDYISGMLKKFNDEGFLVIERKRKRLKKIRLTKKGYEWLKLASKLISDINIDGE